MLKLVSTSSSSTLSIVKDWFKCHHKASTQSTSCTCSATSNKKQKIQHSRGANNAVIVQKDNNIPVPFADNATNQANQQLGAASAASLNSQIVLMMLDTRIKKKNFAALCFQNDILLRSSSVIDGCLLSMCFVYFQRLGLHAGQYCNDNLMCALYLEIAMEEDSEEGVHELLVHCIGVSVDFAELDYTAVKKKQLFESHDNWTHEVSLFYKRCNRFWAALGYKAHVSGAVVSSVMNSFNFCQYFKTRTDSDLIAMAY